MTPKELAKVCLMFMGLGAMIFLKDGAPPHVLLERQIFSSGQATRGVVSDKIRGWSATRYAISYRFPAGSQTYTGFSSVTKDSYTKLQVGQPIEVLYLMDKVPLSEYVGEARQDPKGRWHFFGAVLLEAGLIGLGVALVWALKLKQDLRKLLKAD